MRFGVVVFTDIAIRIRAGGVEIPQREILDAVDLAKPLQRTLERELGFSVGIDRTLWGVLIDRNLFGDALGRARRRKDDVPHLGVLPGRQEIDAAGNRRGSRQGVIALQLDLPEKAKPYRASWRIPARMKKT